MTETTFAPRARTGRRPSFGLFLHNGKTGERGIFDADWPAFRRRSERRTSRRITLHNQARNQPTRERFGDRHKRITRRIERDNFKRNVMPVLYVIAILGLFAFCAAAVYAAIAEADIQPFLPIAVGPVFLIGVMETYRLVRGHHNDSLEEP